VAGGTGTVGRHVTRAAARRGHEVVPFSRTSGVDLITGAGVDAALAGVEVVVDVVGTSALTADAAGAFFTTTAGTLQGAATRAGVQRVVLLSIVGLERASASGYYRAKLEQEAAHRAGPVPLAVLRATQFHEFPGQILQRTRRGPVAMVPRMRTQPIAAATVAEHLLDLAESSRRGEVRQVGGPRPADLVDLARRLVSSRGERIRLVPLHVPGAAGRALRDGSLLPGPDAKLDGPTFDQWLAAGG
jgi:uncharacterized protein YbjT (DUF2867 family)